jgi:hypothetical protein
MKKIILSVIIITVFGLITAWGAINSDMMTTPITKEGLKLLPVPEDYKNYFILQSFEKITIVVIGDFGGQEKVICQIIDRGSDGSVDEINEYYPDTDTYGRPDKPTTRLFSGYPEIKKEIIEGKVFRDPKQNNKDVYTHEMASLPILKDKIKEGRYVTRRGANGRYVRYIDPDIKSSTMADFFFGKDNGSYSLQFRTLYYKNGTIRIEPVLQYSVFCRGSHDPVVVEYVESLLKYTKENRI